MRHVQQIHAALVFLHDHHKIFADLLGMCDKHRSELALVLGGTIAAIANSLARAGLSG